jgi:hypothetical protein
MCGPGLRRDVMLNCLSAKCYADRVTSRRAWSVGNVVLLSMEAVRCTRPTNADARNAELGRGRLTRSTVEDEPYREYGLASKTKGTERCGLRLLLLPPWKVTVWPVPTPAC